MPLPRSTPAAAGVDARGVLGLLDAAAAARLDLHSLMIARRGSVIAEGWWLPYAADRIHLGYSLSKSFTATAIGTLVDDGRVGLDDVVLDHFPWVDRSAVDPKYHRLLVRHCLAMTVGHTRDAWEEVAQRSPDLTPGSAPDPIVAAVFATPPEQEPGSVFAYNQVATYLLGAVVRAVTGADLLDRVTERFLRPLHLPQARWHATPQGHQLGFSGIHTTTETILHLAQLYADGGMAGGTRLLSAAYAEEAVRGAGPARTDPHPSPDWDCGYGFSFWQARHGYRGDGAYGQFAIVLPEQDLTIAITSEVEEMQTVLDLVWEHVLPAVDRQGDGTGDLALADRLARLAIDALPSTQEGPGIGLVAGHRGRRDPGRRVVAAVDRCRLGVGRQLLG